MVSARACQRSSRKHSSTKQKPSARSKQIMTVHRQGSASKAATPAIFYSVVLGILADVLAYTLATQDPFTVIFWSAEYSPMKPVTSYERGMRAAAPASGEKALCGPCQ